MLNRNPEKKLTIVGGGIIGVIEAYYAIAGIYKEQLNDDRENPHRSCVRYVCIP